MNTKGNRRGNPVGICLLAFALAVLIWTGTATAQSDDSFIAGYATAVLEREFNLRADSLRVRNGVIYLPAREIDERQRGKVAAALGKIRGVVRVEFVESAPALEEPREQPGAVERREPRGAVFLPHDGLFDPLVADPRWAHFSASYLNYIDNDELNRVGATSFGKMFELFEFDGPFGARCQFGIQAAVFAIFDLDTPSRDLVNADYWVGLPLGCRRGDWSALLRFIHQSSHLGDEFLLRKRPTRINLSYEGVDFKLSYDLGPQLRHADGSARDFGRAFRIYGGTGYLFARDPADLKPWSTHAGIELRYPWPFGGGTVRPIAAADFQNRQETDWNTDVSLRAGLQLESPRLRNQNLQILLEYYNGHSPNGQFFEHKVEYFGIGLHFYYD